MKPITVIISFTLFTGLSLAGLGTLFMLAGASGMGGQLVAQVASATPTATATLDIPPSTPFPTPTASQTLRPAPTFEPPTQTPQFVASATPTPTSTLGVSVDLPQINGLASPTPTSTPGCEPRKDWKLTYTVQQGDALARIADSYNTDTATLAAGNCLTDANMIRVGQTLRVPGEAHPATPQWVCQTWEVLTPMDWAAGVDGGGQLTFNWRGSNGTRNLIRVYDSNGNLFWERSVDLRQNETINLRTEGFTEGHYTWQVFPLNLDFQQIPCLESPLWHFHVRAAAATQSPSVP
jgi:LysM repeat protein